MGWYHTHMQAAAALDWTAIDTVLLDMDGTLLDLRFDNWFWQELVPQRYAEVNGIGLERARAILEPKFRAAVGTIQWYCIDHWSRELGLNILDIKRTVLAEVRYLPGAERFLAKLRLTGKRIVLTYGMALPKSLNLPFSAIEAADLKIYADGTGDIAFRLPAAKRLSYLLLWPHVRPGAQGRAQPVLRCIPAPQAASEILANAVAVAQPLAAEALVVSDAMPAASRATLAQVA